ncbi:hypothetical protein ACH47Z_13070 [Streptomyces sp. NPDC020192]|uniref:hypothetical protein n=1 Tax=Streptomyces sp. NPDC020192 TaxID=3365066 RepID=UPI0037A8DBEF
MPPPPQQPQQPYGQQPPYGAYGVQPPYGQPPQAAPGPYGSPYPQQQQPYPPQPYPQQQPYPAWGVPPMAPPKKRRVGLILGIVGGVVTLVVVGLVLLGAVVSSGFPAAKNKLTLPKTLLDGKYQLARDLSDTEGKKIEDEADGAWDAKDVHAVVASYGAGGDTTQGALVVSGMYGRFKNTDEARGNMLKGASEADGVTVAVAPKDFPESGSPTVTCEVLTQKKLGETVTYPVCAWSDGNTGAGVASINAKTAKQDPSDVDLAMYAKLTLQVRSEMIKPIS